MSDEQPHFCRRCGIAVERRRFKPERWPRYCRGHADEHAARVKKLRDEAFVWLTIVIVAVGVFMLAGRGWALIALGVLALANQTADVWLPALIARHGRRHESDQRARDR